MKPFFISLLILSCFYFSSCLKESAPSITCGKEWNSGRQVVADTTSEFMHFDPLIVSFNYGKNFDFDSLKCEFIDEASKVQYSKNIKVSAKMGSYTIQGKKNGKEMTAGNFFHAKKTQTVRIRFSSEKSILAEKQIQILKERK